MSDEIPMTFLTTQPDGPHDEGSYVAGWEMGTLNAKLSVCANLRLIPGVQVIHAANGPQADLIAMMHGYLLTLRPVPGMPDCLEAVFGWPVDDDADRRAEQ